MNETTLGQQALDQAAIGKRPSALERLYLDSNCFGCDSWNQGPEGTSRRL